MQVIHSSDTIWVRQCDIPVYLHTSHFLQSWDENGGTVEIFNSVLKQDTTIADVNDLHHILMTLRFWIVHDIPNSVFEFVFSHIDCGCEEILQEFERDLPGIESLLKLIRVPEEERWTASLHYQDENCTRYLLECCQLPSNWPESFITAAGAGSLPCLQYLRGYTFPLIPGACSSAAENGHLACLKFLHDEGCKWDSWTCHHSAANGHADCLQYAIDHGCKWTTDAACAAASNAHVHILRVFLPIRGDGPWMRKVAEEAAKHGQLQCLQYFHSMRVDMDEEVAMYAAEFNHMHCLVYLYEHGYPWGAGTPIMAACKGHFECLKYAIENGCECNENAYLLAANREIKVYIGKLGYGDGEVDEILE